MKRLTLIISFFLTSFVFGQDLVTISGYVKDSKEELLYAKIYIPSLKVGAISNEYGFYSLEVPKKESYTVVVTHVSSGSTKLTVSALENTNIDLVVKSNVNNGYGFFNTHYLDIRFYDLSEF